MVQATDPRTLSECVHPVVRAVHKAIMLAIQLRDFGHDEVDEDGAVFVTTGNQVEFMEDCCLKAAIAARDLVIEECASVADLYGVNWTGRCEVEAHDPCEASEDIAQAIRALKASSTQLDEEPKAALSSHTAEN